MLLVSSIKQVFEVMTFTFAAYLLLEGTVLSLAEITTSNESTYINEIQPCSNQSFCDNSSCPCREARTHLESQSLGNKMLETRMVLSASSPVGFMPGGTTVEVIVCPECFDNVSDVKATSLLVCVIGARNSCLEVCAGLDLSRSSTKSFLTWAEAAKEGFSTPYLALAVNWRQTLTNSSELLTWTLGSDSGCNVSRKGEICNGPIPADRDLVLALIQCSVEHGCDCTAYAGIFTTRARNIPEFNTVGLAVGIAMGTAVVLTTIVLAAVACVRERRVPPKGPQQNFSTTNQIQEPGQISTSTGSEVRRCSQTSTQKMSKTNDIFECSSVPDGTGSIRGIYYKRRSSRLSSSGRSTNASSNDAEVNASVHEFSRPIRSSRRGSRRQSVAALS